MEIIITHEQADFDAAGSVLAAWLMDPSRIPILPKKRNRNLSLFMEDYGDRLPFITWKMLPKGEITRVFVTDTQICTGHKRLDNISDVIVWDHHPRRNLIPDREENIYELTGACTTFLVEKLIGIPDMRPGRIFSTLMLMGIYEDTGFLSYGSTTARDIRASAWLLDQGADLDLLRRYVLQPLTEHQQTVCDQLLKNCRSYEISGEKIMIAAADVRDVSDEYSSVAHHLRDMLSPDGLLILLGTKNGIRLIGRATTDNIDFGRLMERYNGGGHCRAASALIPPEDPENTDYAEMMETLRKQLVEDLPEYIAEPCLNLGQKLDEKLPAARLALVHRVAETAAKLDMPVCIVGGVVRDLLLDRPLMDFDIVAEGDAVRLGKKLSSEYGGKLTVHPQFFTAKWELPDGTSIDLISARAEIYAFPGALPAVSMADLDADLHRRDFTINTLAVRLDGDHYGEILDRCGGLRDLQRQVIRTLHDRSFIDDPTRMFRAVRFEQRFDFSFDPDTLRQLRENICRISDLTGQRIWHELLLYCAEPCPEDDFSRIAQLGMAAQICSGLTWDDALETECVRFRTSLPESFRSPQDREAFAQVDTEGLLWIWLSTCSPETIETLGKRLLLSGNSLRCIRGIAALRGMMPELAQKKNSEITFFLDSVPPAALYCYSRICTSETEQRIIRSYADEWRFAAPSVTGDDLLRMGFSAGPEMRRILTSLRAAWIDGDIRSAEEETAWLSRLGQKE